MTCSEVREYLFAFLDNELDASLSIEIQLHIEQCPICAREVEIERAIREQLVCELKTQGSEMPLNMHMLKRTIGQSEASVVLRRLPSRRVFLAAGEHIVISSFQRATVSAKCRSTVICG